MKLQNAELPRPMTHDLLASRHRAALASVTQRARHRAPGQHLLRGPQPRRPTARRYEVDSRPSDAIALAVRTDAPIFASAELLDCQRHRVRAGGRRRRGDRQGVQQFLDEVSPEDFYGWRRCLRPQPRRPGRPPRTSPAPLAQCRASRLATCRISCRSRAGPRWKAGPGWRGTDR